MKIIRGKLKGRKIEGFDLKGTRPTMDRVKESLFAMIQEHIDNSICLDLFSGSGNLGIEAISMGAKKVYFVDNNHKAINTIKRNVSNFKIENNSFIYKCDYKSAIENLSEKIDIIFLDPPYNTDYIKESIKLITKKELLNKNGLIICESDNKNKIIYDINSFELMKERKYGDKYIVILKIL